MTEPGSTNVNKREDPKPQLGFLLWCGLCTVAGIYPWVGILHGVLIALGVMNLGAAICATIERSAGHADFSARGQSKRS
jgi:hypothetical protein